MPISVVKITNKEQIKAQKNYKKEEAINLGIEKLREKIKSQIENKGNILGTTVDTKEQEEYIDIYLTYEVLENIETYEKIEQ